MVWSRICALAISVITARTLRPEDFGALGYIQTSVAFFGVVAAMGMATTSARFIALHCVSRPGRAQQFAHYSLVMSVAMGALGALLMSALSMTDRLMPDNIQSHASLIMIVSVTLVFSALSGTQTGILSGYRMFKAIARANFVCSLIQPLVTVTLVLLLGLDGAVYAIIVSSIILCISLHIEIRKNLTVMSHSRKNVGGYFLRRFISFGAPLMVSGLVGNFAQWYTVSRLAAAEEGTFQLAIYSIALQWRLALLFIPTALSQVLISFMVKDKQSEPSSLRLRWLIIGAGFALATALALPLALASPLIIGLYGTAYLPAEPVLIIVCITSVPMALAQIAGQIVNADGNVKWSLTGNVIWAALLITSAEWQMANDWTALGLSVCVLIAYVVLALFMMVIALRQRSSGNPRTHSVRAGWSI